jgi:hypothetical protein
MNARAAMAAATGAGLGVMACGLSLTGTGASVYGGEGGAPDASAVDGETTDSGADGARCTSDVTNDPHNCGSCGHDCMGGDCFLGACQPVVFASGLSAPQGVAVDDKNLVWTSPSKGTIGQIPLSGGSSTTIVSGAGQPAYAALGGSDLYWTDRAGGNVMRRALFGGAVTLLARGQPTPTGIALSSGDVYFTAQSKNTLRLVLADGGAVDVTPALDNPEGIAAADGAMVVASPPGHVFSAPLDGGVPDVLVDGLAGEEPTAVAVGRGAVYFTLRKSGKVARYQTATRATDILAEGQLQPTGIAVDASAIYWADTGSGKIMRLAL